MPLQALPIPVGDVMPGGGGGLPQKLLPPGPGIQAWPGAPSQMKTGSYCISSGGEAGRPDPAPGHRYGGVVSPTPSTEDPPCHGLKA